jgi:GTP pyrophosphokinase
MEFQRELKTPKEFLDSMRLELFSDEVYVFTPKGDVKSLPRGATPVDFAYAVHSEVGHHCVGSKVNGKIVPLRYRLKNGDTVEVLTSPHSHPSKDWLTFVRTSRAQARIRQHIRQAEHKRSLEIGHEVAERELRRYGLSLHRLQKDGALDKAAETLGYRIGDDVLVALGYGRVAPDQLLKQLVPPEKLAEATPPEPAAPSRLTELFRRVARLPAGGVRISGIDDVLVRFGKCCAPLPGDAIVGFITRGRGVTVHTARCEKALAMDPLRRVDVSWDVKGDFKRAVSVRVVAEDKPGMLAKVSQTFSEAGINIAQANVRSTADRAVLSFEVAVQDLKQLTSVMKSLERVEGVHTVERV